ncbi:TniQ family protein [Thioclava sp. GXIMD4216]|uniref:TniQ family protein n=1 Tax=Thioclava sp. GXIMD4216 TaxID=3131929 RepID=UPI0030CF1D80
MAKSRSVDPEADFAPLPLTVQHERFEPASSLLTRLAARNGAPSVYQFCADLAFPVDPLFRGEPLAIAQLAQLAGCDASTLARVSICHLGHSRFRLRDEIAMTHSLQRTRIRICPVCLRREVPSAEEAWRMPRRLPWKFTSVRSCADHGCLLVTLLPEKFTKDGRDFAAQVRKHFGWVLSQGIVPAETGSFERYLLRRILNGRGDAWLDRFELNIAARLCEVLGLLLKKGPEATLSGHDEHDWGQYGEAGYQVLKGGELGFLACLQELAEQHAEKRFFGRIYGPLVTWLQGRGLGDEVEPLRALMRREIFARFSIRKGVQVFGVPSEGIAARNEALVPSIEGFSLKEQALLVRRALAYRQEDGTVVAKSFVTETMLSAFGRELGEQTEADEDPSEADELSVVAYLIADASGYLRITDKTVRYLVHAGILSLASSNNEARSGAQQISLKSLEAFRQRFMSLGELADHTQSPAGALSTRLRNAGVATLPMLPDLSRIYWRADLVMSGLLAEREAKISRFTL